MTAEFLTHRRPAFTHGREIPEEAEGSGEAAFRLSLLGSQAELCRALVQT